MLALVGPRWVWTHADRVNIQEPGTREGVSSQGAGGQVRVFMLELPIQGKAPLLSIVGQEGGQRVDLAER